MPTAMRDESANVIANALEDGIARIIEAVSKVVEDAVSRAMANAVPGVVNQDLTPVSHQGNNNISSLSDGISDANADNDAASTAAGEDTAQDNAASEDSLYAEPGPDAFRVPCELSVPVYASEDSFMNDASDTSYRAPSMDAIHPDLGMLGDSLSSELQQARTENRFMEISDDEVVIVRTSKARSKRPVRTAVKAEGNTTSFDEHVLDAIDSDDGDSEVFDHRIGPNGSKLPCLDLDFRRNLQSLGYEVAPKAQWIVLACPMCKLCLYDITVLWAHIKMKHGIDRKYFERPQMDKLQVRWYCKRPEQLDYPMPRNRFIAWLEEARTYSNRRLGPVPADQARSANAHNKIDTNTGSKRLTRQYQQRSKRASERREYARQQEDAKAAARFPLVFAKHRLNSLDRSVDVQKRVDLFRNAELRATILKKVMDKMEGFVSPMAWEDLVAMVNTNPGAQPFGQLHLVDGKTFILQGNTQSFIDKARCIPSFLLSTKQSKYPAINEPKLRGLAIEIEGTRIVSFPRFMLLAMNAFTYDTWAMVYDSKYALRSTDASQY